MKPINKDDLLRTLPPEWPQDLRPMIRKQVTESNTKIVVLDDDPTGTQTVHGIPVLTGWSVEVLRAELENDGPAFYVLTNSRSLPLPEARAMNSEIGRHLREAAEESGRPFVVVSRSDSTLRGHFPGEVEALAEGLSQNFDAWIVIPFSSKGAGTPFTTPITWMKGADLFPRPRRNSPRTKFLDTHPRVCGNGSRRRRKE